MVNIDNLSKNVYTLFINMLKRGIIMANYSTISSDKSKSTALGLCCLGFIGLGGIHDFYLGNYGKGIIKICTMNLFLIGTILDLIKIASGGYRDNSGQCLRQ